MELNDVDIVICLTKIDLISKETYEKIKELMVYYNNIGYKVITNNDVDKIKELVKDKTVVFIGQTGAGKSTLLNKLNPNWNLKIGEVSLALGRGRHTTRNVELYDFLDGKVLDTPGFSALDLSIYKKENIKYAFKEFSNYNCPFRDCTHTKEKECMIKKAVDDSEILKSRYDSYLKFYEEAIK
jgi:ribosome small subunit-dependent GTPase A